ncbi:hypothetical protein EBR96_02215 [bacterium]|nr:hypothetical protein [bacterium]
MTATLTLVTGGLIAIFLSWAMGWIFQAKSDSNPIGACVLVGLTAYAFVSIGRVSGPLGMALIIGALLISITGLTIANSVNSPTKQQLGGVTFTLWAVCASSSLISLHYWGTGVLLGIVGALVARTIHWSVSEPVHTLRIQVSKQSALNTVDAIIREFKIVPMNYQALLSNELELELQYSASPITHHLFVRNLLSAKGIGKVERVRVQRDLVPQPW